MECSVCLNKISVGFELDNKIFCIKDCPNEIKFRGETIPYKKLEFHKRELNLEII